MAELALKGESFFKKYIKEIAKRRDLMLYLVTSGLRAQHRDSVLGYFWWLLDPLLNVSIYYFVVVIIFKSGGEGYGAYLVVGMIVWRWMQATISQSSRCITNQSGIITQVYLPKAIFPFGAALTQLINFGFGLVIIAVFLAFLKIIPGMNIIWLPYIILVQLLFQAAIALLVAYVCVFIRDVENIVNHLLRLWFYTSPVIWQDRLFPERIRWLLDLNPMTHLLISYRNVILYDTVPLYFNLFVLGLLSVCFIVLLILFYSQFEHRIIKAL